MQRQGIIPGYAPLKGQEAAQIGSGAALDLARDFAFPTYREMGVAVAMGVDLIGYFASHHGSWHGGLYDPLASRFAPINAVVAGSVLHAMGWAKGEKLSHGTGVSLAYFGDGASSQGDVHEAMNFAGVDDLPVIFFCQNNGWAISLPTERQVAGGSVAARAAGYGLAAEVIDGNDVVEVFEATNRALQRARSGGGATVIEAMTYRVGPHSTSDDPGRYRSIGEEQSWALLDPIDRLAQQLRAAGADDAFFESARTDARETVETVRTGLVDMTDRPLTELFDFVFTNPTPRLLEQRDAYLSNAYLSNEYASEATHG